MKAYVYTHTRLDTNEIFYIGIGTQDNYRRASRCANRSIFWKNIVNKTGWKVDIVFDNLSWEDACIKEKELIAFYGRKDIGTGILVNHTNGGDGSNGRVFSQETRNKMAKTRKGAKWTEEQKEKARLSMLGKNKKKVINSVTGEIYDSVENAAKAIGYSRENLINKLRGKLKNNTNLKYY
jgi:hypothetical protein